MSVGARIRQLRQQAGLSQTSLARPKYTVSYVSLIEAGRRVPSTDALSFFAEKLGVTPKFLETGVPDDVEERLRYALEEIRLSIRRGATEGLDSRTEQVLGEVRSAGIHGLEGPALVARADALILLDRVREAVEEYEAALKHALSDGERGMVISSLARAYRHLGDLAYALDLVERFLDERRDTPLDLSVAAELHSVLVSLYFDRGDVTRAEAAARRALDIAEQGAEPEARANAYWDASRILAEERRWDEALALADRARAIMLELDDRRSVARLHNVYAYLCLEIDPPRLREAKRHLDVAERQLKEVGSETDLAYLYADRARAALLERKAKEAQRFADRGLESVGANPLQRGSLLYLKGRAFALLGNADEAEKSLREAAAIFQERGARQLEATCWRELGELQLQLGDPEAAVETLRAGLHALDPLRARA